MGTKCEALALLARGEGPLYKVADEEPIFILRAQDKFFVPLVRMWIELVEMDTARPVSEAVSRKILEALDIANKALDWQDAHPGRVKVPD